MADAIFEPEIKRSLLWLQKSLGGNLPPIAIECKRTSNARLSFDAVKDEQVDGLTQFCKKGIVRKLIVSQGLGARRFTGGTPFDFLACGAGYGYLLVNFRFTKQSPRKDIAKGTNRCFAVPVDQYVQAREDAAAEGHSSLPYDWFAENAIECKRMRVKNEQGVAESGWDLSVLLTQ
jgi:hypothetical protein